MGMGRLTNVLSSAMLGLVLVGVWGMGCTGQQPGTTWNHHAVWDAAVGVDADAGENADAEVEEDAQGSLPVCGDGMRDGTEDCDGTDLGGASCTSVAGHLEGTLACLEDCTFDTRACHTCGDYTIEGPEICDQHWVGLETCLTQVGLPDGTLVCLADCTGYDVSVCHTCGDGVLDGPESCEDGNTVDWDGCTGCFLSEIQANTYTADDQRNPALATSAAGSLVLVWDSGDGIAPCQDGDGFGVFGQRFDTTGLPVGAELQINTHTLGDQQNPSVAMTGYSGFVVVWTSGGQDGDGLGVFGQRFDGTGLPVGGEFQVNTYSTGDQSSPEVASAADGSFVVTWTSDGQDGSLDGVYAQRFDTTGAALGPEQLVNTYVLNQQWRPRIAMTADGQYVIVWTSYGQDGSDGGIFGQRFSADGSPSGSELAINTITFDSQSYPAVSMAANGSFVVVWRSFGHNTSGLGTVHGQRYDSASLPAGSEFQVAASTTHHNGNPRVSMAGDGRFVVVWQRWLPYWHPDVYGRRYDTLGAPVSGAFPLSLRWQHAQSDPVVALLDDGRFIAAWQSDDQDDHHNGIFFQRFDATGAPLGTTP